MTRTCRQEPWEQARPAIETLMAAQWAETGDSRFPLDPNWTVYDLMDKTRRLVIMVLREDDRPSGYAGGMVHPHMNSKRMLVATIPTWYVEPMPGRPFVEKALLQEVGRRLVALGAQDVTIETNADQSAAKLLEVMGGKPRKIAFGFPSSAFVQEQNDARSGNR